MTKLLSYSNRSVYTELLSTADCCTPVCVLSLHSDPHTDLCTCCSYQQGLIFTSALFVAHRALCLLIHSGVSPLACCVAAPMTHLLCHNCVLQVSWKNKFWKMGGGPEQKTFCPHIGGLLVCSASLRVQLKGQSIWLFIMWKASYLIHISHVVVSVTSLYFYSYIWDYFWHWH